MKHTTLALTVIAVAAFGLGCHSGNIAKKGNTELHMGLAHHEMVKRQIADPSAGERNTRPVSGMDPTTAAGVQENYEYNEKAETQEKKARNRALRVLR